MIRKLEVIFDNGGGVHMQGHKWQCSYNDGWQAGRDAAKILAGASPLRDGWLLSPREYRLTPTGDDIRNEQENRLRYEYNSNPKDWVATTCRAQANDLPKGSKAGEIVPVLAMRASLGNPLAHVIFEDGTAWLVKRENVAV